jgi:hypothetical protein
MRYKIRPLGPWLEAKTDPRRGAHLFRANWDTTLVQLEYETAALGADLVIIQVDMVEGDLRRDGMLRAHARVGFPGVRVSFDSKFGPLTYATDAYDDGYDWVGGKLKGWQANVRAIALALEALRAVDRYGVTRRGEQYSGWTAIDSRPAEMSREQAAMFIAIFAEPDSTEKRSACAAAILRGDPDALAVAYKRAAKRAHPDVGGDHDTMARLSAARDLIQRAGGDR